MQAKDDSAYRVMQPRFMQKAGNWQELEGTRLEVAELRAALAEQNASNAQLRSLADALYASTSWRISGPLRAFARLFLRR